MKLTKEDLQNLLELHDMGVQVLAEADNITPEEYHEKAQEWLQTITKIRRQLENPQEGAPSPSEFS